MQNQMKKQFAMPSLTANRDLAELVLRHLVCALLGALFAGTELLFGVKPFALALTAAAAEFMPAVALGAAAVLLVSADYVAVGALALVVGLRVILSLFRRKEEGAETALFDAPPSRRILIAAGTALVMGTAVLLRGGLLYFDLFALALSVVSVPLCTLLYLGIFSEEASPLPEARTFGIAAVVLTGVFSLRTVSILGVYPAAVIAAGVAFALTARKGILFGALGGFMAGLCFDPPLAPAFALSAVAFGLLEKSSRGGAVLTGGASAAAYALLVGKNAALIKLLPSLLAAGALFLATDSAGLIEGAPARQMAVARRRGASETARAAGGAVCEKRMTALSEALGELSSMFSELSRRLEKPDAAALKRLCDRAFDGTCPHCPHKPLCWGTEYEISTQTVSKMAHFLQTSTPIGKGHFPPDMLARCPHTDRLLSTINENAALQWKMAAEGDRTTVVAADYAALSRAIQETLTEVTCAFVGDDLLGARIAERLIRQGYTLETAAVCGETHRRVILRGIRLPGRHLKIRELRRHLERLCRFPLGEPQITEREGFTDMIFAERPRLKSCSVKLCRPKGREDRYCGDSVTALSVDGYDYAFICDGMGSGNAAAYTSALAAAFLSRLLQAESRPESALCMLNGFLAVGRRREGEVGTTVDLLELDRVSGDAVLYKCGAAPTYLLRRGELSRFACRTAPVGILEVPDAERIRFRAEPGDVIVQISDGFTGGEEHCAFLEEMLKTKWDGDSEAFARMALNRATGMEPDDLSIIVTTVTAADGAKCTEQAG